MKHKEIAGRALAMVAICMMPYAPAVAPEQPTAPADERTEQQRSDEQRKEELHAQRLLWLEELVQCESGGDPTAVNPADLDGTPSYGLLQFKPSTFEMYSKRYGIEGELMDPQVQRAIVMRMMDDPKVRWSNEFPWCVEKKGVGYPPGVLR